MSNPNALTVADESTRAIAAATTVDEITEIIDRIAAVKAYVDKKMGRHSEEARRLKEAELRAQRKLGELTAALPKAKPPGKKSNTVLPNSKGAALDSVGIHKVDASRAEAIARIPEDVFEAEVVKPTASTAKLVRVSKALNPKQPRTKAQRAKAAKKAEDPRIGWLTTFAQQAQGYVGAVNDPYSKPIKELGQRALFLAKSLANAPQKEI